jgi:hypothetical protein
MDAELVLLVWDNPKPIRAAARVLKVRADRVSVHVATLDGSIFRAVFIDGHLQNSKESKRAMNLIQGSPLQVPRRYRALVELQKCSR